MLLLGLLVGVLVVPVPAAAHDDPPPPPGDPGAAAAGQPCRDGRAGRWTCHDVDLVAFVPRDALGLAAGDVVNDVWGWTDAATGIEYALVGTAAGTAFVSLEDPAAPRWLGNLPTRSQRVTWRDLKTYRDHVFVVADTPAHGLQVFDLTRLRGVASPREWTADAVYAGPGLGALGGFFLGSSHNLALDPATGFAFATGSDTCGGGLHMIDVRQPLRPRFAGCSAATGYVHDAQCVVYAGPDGRFAGHEVCFNSNVATLSIHDVSDKGDPRVLANVGYPGVEYAHQGWLTDDHRYFLLGDELDELRNGHLPRTYVWDVADLTAPRLVGAYDSPVPATDHNLYVLGRHVFQANYLSGLRVLELVDPARAALRQVAFFDTVPERQRPGFDGGAWSVYPFFDSGLVIVTSIAEGLFVLRPRLDDRPAGALRPRPEGAPAPADLRRGLGRRQ